MAAGTQHSNAPKHARHSARPSMPRPRSAASASARANAASTLPNTENVTYGASNQGGFRPNAANAAQQDPRTTFARQRAVAAATAGAAAGVAAAAAIPAGNNAALPTTDYIQNALDRERSRAHMAGTVRSTLFVLVVAAAAAVLVAVLFLPILRIYGTSMHGTLDAGDIVVSAKTSTFKTGDVMAFYYNNNILVKRVIANPGDWVDIDQDGNVYVNNQMLDEPYLSSKAYGDTNITLPYQVPDGKVFVMGDNREVSIDSRNTSVGCVSSEQIVGKIVFRIWPFSEIGTVR